MPRRLLELVNLFNCKHEFSWPRRREGGEYYQVCLLCGVEYCYDWHSMQRTGRAPRESSTSAGATIGTRHQRRPHRSWRPRERRIKCESVMTFRARGTAAWQDGVLENVSRSGILFRTEKTATRGQRIELTLEMPQEIIGRAGSRVLALGRVTRVIAGTDGGPIKIATSIESYRLLAAECA